MEQFLEKFLKLSPKEQIAIYWLIENFDTAIKMCEEGKLSEEQWNDLKQKAIETDDTMLLLLVELDRLINFEQSP